MRDPKFIVVDLFCGAGGTTTGFTKAIYKNYPAALVVACVNHDAIAIESHWANHPEVYHFNEDITKLYGYFNDGIWFKTPELLKLQRIVDIYRAFYPKAKVILWASLECTNFSNAKGGQPRDADSRTLAEHLHYYVDSINPDYVQIENVVEFMAWGPLDDNGKPISREKGTDWIKWREKMCDLHGMVDIWNTMNSANYGSYTSRNRLFGCFAKPGMPIAWPKPTFAKVPKDGKQQWKAVREVLDFEDEGTSIFTRKKELSDNTLERIYDSLIKFVAKGDMSFLSLYYGSGGTDASIHGPSLTIPTVDRIALVQYFIDKQYGTGRGASVDKPIGTITNTPKFNLVSIIYNPSHGGHAMSTDVPCPVIVAWQDKAPLYLIRAEGGPVAIPVYAADSEIMIKIKLLVSYYGLSDVKMRMLKILELKVIQGFPAGYILLGTQKDQKKFIGNSVEPNVVTAWAEVLADEIEQLEAA